MKQKQTQTLIIIVGCFVTVWASMVYDCSRREIKARTIRVELELKYQSHWYNK